MPVWITLGHPASLYLSTTTFSICDYGNAHTPACLDHRSLPNLPDFREQRILIGNPILQSRERSFLGSSPRRLEPTFLKRKPEVSVTPPYLASGVDAPQSRTLAPREETTARALVQKLTRIRHKRPFLPRLRYARGGPSIYSVSPLRALDRTAWFAVVAGFSTGPLPKKICTSNFYSKRTSKLTFRSARRSTDTIALYSSPIHRLTALGPEALTETDTLSLLLDASDSRLAVWRTSPQQYADEINRWKDNW
jgi:hypothetical protein